MLRDGEREQVWMSQPGPRPAARIHVSEDQQGRQSCQVKISPESAEWWVRAAVVACSRRILWIATQQEETSVAAEWASDLSQTLMHVFLIAPFAHEPVG